MTDLKELLAKLVAYPSITPTDAGCNDFMIEMLSSIGFHCETIDALPVKNFFARLGESAPLLVFAGHSDVVPVGEASKWHSDPFALHEDGDKLYGRGTADMKGSLACMLTMAQRFAQAHPNFSGSLGFLITSAEEGDQFDLGTPLVMKHLYDKGVNIDYCVVGEPSSTNTVGDVIKVGRRGSLTANLTLHGKQGHVAYPHLAQNPIHCIATALAELTTTSWDAGNHWFPATSMQITSINSGGHAANVIPGELDMQFNFRFSTELNAEKIQTKVQECFSKHQLKPDIRWRLNGEPFLTKKGRLLDASILAVKTHTNQEPELSTSGGTSDGRFIAPYGVEVIELGPVNESIHQVNEWVSLSELKTLEAIYLSIAELVLLR